VGPNPTLPQIPKVLRTSKGRMGQGADKYERKAIRAVTRQQPPAGLCLLRYSDLERSKKKMATPAEEPVAYNAMK